MTLLASVMFLMTWGRTCPMIAARHSELSPEKLQAFCIITWEILSLLYYHLTNPKPSVLLLEKSQALCVIT